MKESPTTTFLTISIASFLPSLSIVMFHSEGFLKIILALLLLYPIEMDLYDRHFIYLLLLYFILQTNPFKTFDKKKEMSRNPIIWN